MKLGNLIDLYEKMFNSDISVSWDKLFADIISGETSKYPNDQNVYAVNLSVGELALSKIIQSYDNLNNIAFSIGDTKNKVKIPEFGISISCAEQELALLRHKLFYYHRLGVMVNEMSFKIVGTDENSKDLDVEVSDLNKGFNINSVNNTLEYLNEEIKKYEDCINKTIWATEISVPFLENKTDDNFSFVKFPAKEGTLKNNPSSPQPTAQKNVEVDMSEYVDASQYIKQAAVENPPIVSQKAAFQNCAVCGSIHRDNIETFYNESQGDMLQTLQFAADNCQMPSITPNTLLNHLDNHSKTISTSIRNVNNSDKHTAMDHALNNSPAEGFVIPNPSKMKNIAAGAYNPNKHSPTDHAV